MKKLELAVLEKITRDKEVVSHHRRRENQPPPNVVVKQGSANVVISLAQQGNENQPNDTNMVKRNTKESIKQRSERILQDVSYFSSKR